MLVLVDLAGSENRFDSLYHDADRRREGAAINVSLMALKDCVRAHASGSDVSHCYRQSKLTMALRRSFAAKARTTVIVTVSPRSVDTEQSMNSLKHACLMAPHGACTDSSSTDTPAGVSGKKPTAVPESEPNPGPETARKRANAAITAAADAVGSMFVQELGVPRGALVARQQREAAAAAVFSFVDEEKDSDACKENKRTVAALEKQLENPGPGLTLLARGGLKKQLAVAKAAVMRETRRQQAEAEAKPEI